MVWVLLILGIMGVGELYAKNVILFIGDGVGQNWITAARIEKAARGDNSPLVLDSLPYTAILKTSALDNVVTDSAAAASAMATGKKINLGAISVDASGKSLKTLSDIAKSIGYRVGIVTNTTITHATPAAFYAHTKFRSQQKFIANQLLQSNLDLFLGGGKKNFDTMALKNNQKFKIFKKKKALRKNYPLTPPILGLFAEKHLDYMGTRKEGSKQPTLSQMTEFSIKHLSASKNGFLLMIEGGRIDHAGHDTEAGLGIEEMLEFDRAIAKALKLVDPKNTLVLVTADHETGGLSVNGYFPHGMRLIEGREKKYRVKKLPNETPLVTFATPKKAVHTATDVPIFGWGFDASKVHGTFENTKVFEWVSQALKVNSNPTRAE